MILSDLLGKMWLGLLQELAVADLNLGKLILKDLMTSYSQPSRYYHNLKHIQEILALLPQVTAIAQSDRVLQLSTWFHDYVYDPAAKDNEALSAVYAETTLRQLKIDSETIYLTTQLIRSTQNHQPLINNPDNLLFLDLDLAILGANRYRYYEYAKAIRQEYQYLSDRQYYLGRSKVLTQFLKKPRIYYTDYFYSRLEITARNNIKLEIEQLISKS